MYESFYRFSLDPFRMGPDHDLCYVHRSYGKAKAYLRYALLQREGFVMVTGESGTGKTTLIGELLAELDSQEYVVARLATAQLAGRDLVRSVAYALALSAEGLDQATVLRDIGRYLDDQHRAGKRVLLVVDEAQDLEMGALTELRLLANAQNGSELLLQIFMVGQDSLASRVRRADMQQFHQRIIAACHLEPLSRDETRGYIEHRLRRAGWQGDPRIGVGVFPAVHRFSRGGAEAHQSDHELIVAARVERGEACAHRPRRGAHHCGASPGKSRPGRARREALRRAEFVGPDKNATLEVAAGESVSR